MGTNYYFHEKPACPCCEREFESVHIGKSSGGWCFSLHVVPELGINSLDDWRARWIKPGSSILNEYGDKVPIDEMESIVTDRVWRGEEPRRHDVDGRHCVGRGEGTWDLIASEFS
jgi:hypothetical protein